MNDRNDRARACALLEARGHYFTARSNIAAARAVRMDPDLSEEGRANDFWHCVLMVQSYRDLARKARARARRKRLVTCPNCGALVFTEGGHP